MKAKSKYLFYITNKLSIFLILGLLFLIFKMHYAVALVIFYIVINSLYFFIFNKDFIIENDGVVFLSHKKEKYDFETVAKIIFVEKNWLIGGSQKIKIIFFNGQKKVINCNGLSSDDEHPDSFYQVYKYVESIFQNTQHQEYFIVFKLYK